MNTETLTEYLRTEIPALELSALLDALLHNMVEWIHLTGQPWSDEEVSTYHHPAKCAGQAIRRLRDLFRCIAEGAMQVQPITAIAS